METRATAVTDSAGRATLGLTGSRVAVLAVGVREGEVPDRESLFPLLRTADTVDVRVAMTDAGPRIRDGGGPPPALRWGRAVRLAWRIQERQYDRARARKERGSVPERGDAPPPGPGTVPDPDPETEALIDSAWTALSSESDAEVRNALAYAVLTAGSTLSGDPERADRALEVVESTAAVWELAPGAVGPLVWIGSLVAERVMGVPADAQTLAGRGELAVRRSLTYLDRVITEHPDPEVRRAVLFYAMRQADQAGRVLDALEYRNRLLSQFPGSAEARRAEADPPGRELGPGSPVPEVALPPLDTTEDPFSPADLAGSVTLIDFWATWCIPCVAELPVLQDAHRRFHERGFRIVSVSYDGDREAVRRFMAERPMPWRHAFVGLEELSTGRVASAYGVDALPHAVLVGPDGHVLAAQGELRGSALARTLQRVLGTPDEPADADSAAPMEAPAEPAADSASPWWLGG
jgi:thiol-disulfide isomerase/thioredoxin